MKKLTSEKSMEKKYAYKNCQSLFGYAESVHKRSGGICQLCGCGAGKEINFDLWRQMTVEHLIGKSQGGHIRQIREALVNRFPELPLEEYNLLAKRIDDANTVTACSFCNSSTSREAHSKSMAQLINDTQGTPDEIVAIVVEELNGVLSKKRAKIQWKLVSIRPTFDEHIQPELQKTRGNLRITPKTSIQERPVKMTEVTNENIKTFVNDDEGYLQWLRQNEAGFVVNCGRKPNPGYLMLHRATCGTIMNPTRGPGNWTTSDYIKICSSDKTELRRWAEKEVGGQLQPCQVCKP